MQILLFPLYNYFNSILSENELNRTKAKKKDRIRIFYILYMYVYISPKFTIY